MSDTVKPAQGEVVLEQGWDEKAECKIEEVSDKELADMTWRSSWTA